MIKVVILGAGISGLSLAWFLKKQLKNSIELIILEKSDRPGGLIKSVKKEDCLLELGPKSLRTSGNEQALELIEELNLQNEVIKPSRNAKKRYIYVEKQFKTKPKGLLKACLIDLVSFSKLKNDLSLKCYATLKFGKEIAENIFDPLVAGIFAGRLEHLSLKSCFPKIYEMEVKKGSILRSGFFNYFKKKKPLSSFIKMCQKERLISFKNGMQTITDALALSLKQELLLSSNINKLTFLEDGITISYNDTHLKADFVFSALPSNALKDVIDKEEIVQLLHSFYSTSVATVSLAYKEKILNKEGFGYLIPSKEDEDILGVVFDSSLFKTRNPDYQTCLTVMFGKERLTNFDCLKPEDFLKLSLKALEKQLHIVKHPDMFHVEIIPHAIGQYLLGHDEKIKKLNTYFPSQFQILGASFYGVSVGDCIYQSFLRASEFSSRLLQKKADKNTIVL